MPRLPPTVPALFAEDQDDERLTSCSIPPTETVDHMASRLQLVQILFGEASAELDGAA